MQTPHLGLLRAYGNTEVFFKTACKEARLSDEIGWLLTPNLMEKISALPAVPGAMATRLSAPVKAIIPKLPPVPGAVPGKLTPPTDYKALMEAKGPLPKVTTPPKPAGASSTPPTKGGLPWNRMLLTGGALGAGYLGLKGMEAGLGFLGGNNNEPANYGSAPGGYYPPMGVNSYGQPQLGTRLM